MNMKKRLLFLLVAIMMAFVTVLASCGGDENPSTSVVSEHKVTFYDGDTVLKTDTVKNGEKAVSYTPEKEGYSFLGWYGTPTFRFEFDFNKAITEDTGIYAKFQEDSFERDTRTFYIVGSGTSAVLEESNWGKVCGDNQKLTLSDKANVNEHTITLDLLVGDQFQFAINAKWNNQRGGGYFETMTKDSVEHFKSLGSHLTSNTKKANVEVLVSGNYTFTLTTYPNLDTYDEADEFYTEENRENFNYSEYDKITWVRNGDVENNVEEKIYDIYVKGQMITGWDHIREAEYMMTFDSATRTYTYTHQFFAGDQFMFYTLGDAGLGPLQIKYGQIDLEKSTTNLVGDAASDSNIGVSVNGTYTFTYNLDTRVCVVTYDPEFNLEYVVNQNWYIVGGGSSELLSQSNWGRIDQAILDSTYKLVKDGETNNFKITLDLQKNDEFQIVKDKNWGLNKGFTYVSNPVVDGVTYFKDSGGNICAEVAGNYTLTLECSSEGAALDKITWVRNSDVLSTAVVEYDFYMKTDVVEAWAPVMKGTVKSNSNLKFEVNLAEGEKFCFVYQPKGEAITQMHPGNIVRYNALGSTGSSNSLFTTNEDQNYIASKAGKYLITVDFTSGAPVIDFEEILTVEEYKAIIKGSWDSKWTPSADMYSKNGVVSFNWTFEVGHEFGLTYWLPSFEGDAAKYGVFVNYTFLGTDGSANDKFEAKSATNNNIVCKEAGLYNVVLVVNAAGAHVDFYKLEEARVIIKGNWTDNWAPSEEMNTVKGVLEFNWTFAENAEFGLTYWLPSFEGDAAKYGVFMNYSYVGTEGKSNSNFAPKNAENVKSNIVCKTAGTYKVKVTFSGLGAIVDFTLVEEARVIIKGNWSADWAPSEEMNTVNGVLEFNWTFAENAEFGLTYWLPSFEGDAAKYGVFMNYSYLGTTGASNSNFGPKNADNVKSNIVCKVAGTYTVRVDMNGESAVVDFTLKN